MTLVSFVLVIYLDTSNDDWRPHLAMILARESDQPNLCCDTLERLGHNLLSRKLVFGAHLCYLLMDCVRRSSNLNQSTNDTNKIIWYRLPERIWLLGIQDYHQSCTEFYQTQLFILGALSESIQLTEIYEYAIGLGDPNYRLKQLIVSIIQI